MNEIKLQLCNKAVAVLEHAYARYSNYRVGACLITEQGGVFIGTNVENSSYGGTICAERSAICAAISAEGPTMRIKAVAIATESSVPAAPCGICRQVIAEFMSDEGMIYLTGADKNIQEYKFGDLLPLAFRPEALLI
jgi:cytidine deaminase